MTFEQWLEELFWLRGYMPILGIEWFAKNARIISTSLYRHYCDNLSPQQSETITRAEKNINLYRVWFDATELPLTMYVNPDVHNLYVQGKGPWEAAGLSLPSEWPQGL